MVQVDLTNVSRRFTILLILSFLTIREMRDWNYFQLSTESVLSNPFEKNWTTSLTSNHSTMRACIMIKNDNRRLKEWVAYHFTVMPLRHLIVASDVNAIEDPMDVLSRWNHTRLNYQVWYGDDLFRNYRYAYKDEVMKYIQRQSYFFSRCMQHFHREGNLGWITLSDSDEYLKVNPLDKRLNEKFFPNEHPKQEMDSQTIADIKPFLSENETWWDRVAARKALRQRLGLDRNNTDVANQTNVPIPTVVDALEVYSSAHSIPHCLTVARLQYSAVMDNVTNLASSICHPPLDPDIVSSMNVSELTTIRYLYHAKPNEFDNNKWSKVLIDLRRYKYESLDEINALRNPHAPLYDCHRPPFVSDVASILRVNHYLDDVGVFVGRKDDPRQKGLSDWSKSAHIRHQTTCDHMYGWLNQFVREFGMEKANELLFQETASSHEAYLER